MEATCSNCKRDFSSKYETNPPLCDECTFNRAVEKNSLCAVCNTTYTNHTDTVPTISIPKTPCLLSKRHYVPPREGAGVLHLVPQTQKQREADKARIIEILSGTLALAEAGKVLEVALVAYVDEPGMKIPMQIRWSRIHNTFQMIGALEVVKDFIKRELSITSGRA